MGFLVDPDSSSPSVSDISDEETPLLPSDASRRHSTILDVAYVPQAHDPRMIVLIMTSVIMCAMVGSFLIMAPATRIYEDIICHHYYDNLDSDAHIGLMTEIDEKLCKVDAIQEELAIVMGGESFVAAIPGLFFAVPYGLMADRIGRKKVFGLAITGIVLSQLFATIVCWFWKIFPLRLVWLAPVFQTIGGGQTVLQNMVFAILSDASDDSTRANNFFISSCGSLIAELVTPSVASLLMTRSPWIPYFLGLVVLAAGASGIILVPENMTPRVTPSPSSFSLTGTEQDLDGQAPSTLVGRLCHIAKRRYANFHAATSILHSPAILLLIFTFLIHPLQIQAISLCVRYVSKRYSWTISEANFLQSLRAGVNIFLLLAILPLLSHFLTSTPKSNTATSRLSHVLRPFQCGLPTRNKDLILARVSLAFLIMGFALLAFSPTVPLAITSMVVFTLGTGFSSLCRSLITTLVDQQHVGRLYAAISVVETVGGFAGGPILAGLFAWGLRMSGRGDGPGSDLWMGAPYWGLSIMCLVTGSSVLFVDLEKHASSESAKVSPEEAMFLDTAATEQVVAI